MKIKIPTTREVNVTHVHVCLPVRYGEEDIPNDFPRRIGDIWVADIEIETGKILEWPEGRVGSLQMKVVDSGCYELFDERGNMVASKHEDYVPNKLIPGEYGDYVDLKINEHGVITNWPKKPDLSEFFDYEEV